MAEKRFSQHLIERMPSGMTMPPVLVEVMDWLEAQGGRETSSHGEALPFEHQSLALYPLEEWQTPGATLAAFGYYGEFSLKGPPPPVADEAERTFFFVRTGGEGSYAGFWLDDAGKQWIVHHGSGSGSDWWGRISDDPKDLLRLMAIGYVEPAFYEVHGATLMESALKDNGVETIFELAQLIAEQRIDEATSTEDFNRKRDELAEDLADQLQTGDLVDEDYVLPYPPRAFQAYLKEAHGIETPERASDFLPYPAQGDAHDGSDPFNTWMEDNTPEPTAEEMARIEEITKMAERYVADQDKPTLWERLRGLFRR